MPVVSPSAPVAWLPFVVSIIQATCLLAGVVIAYKGLSTWRRQRVDGRKIDIAEAALRGFARMQDILFSISHAAVFSGEMEQIKSEFLKNLSKEEQDRVAAYAAPLFREQRYQEEIKDFFDQVYVCRAYFGKEAETHFDKMRSILVDIRVASQMLAMRDRSEPADEDTRNLYEDMRKTIWMGSIDQHPLHIKTVETVEGATIFFGKEIRSR